jgi:hypothetical protein
MLFLKQTMPSTIAIVMISDLILTLACQPDAYWQDYAKCNESNPIGIILLSASPVCFAISFIAYMTFVVWAAKRFAKYSLVFLINTIILTGHIWASVSWLPGLFYRSFSISIDASYLYASYLAFVAITILAIRLWRTTKKGLT